MRAMSLALRHELVGLGGVVERNIYLVKRYIWWDVAFFLWTVANTLTIVFIAKGIPAVGGQIDVPKVTTTLLVGAVIWAYLGIIFEILTETVAWERWELTIEYTFMAPLSRPVHPFGLGAFAAVYGIVRAVLLSGVVAAFSTLHVPHANYIAALALLLDASISFIGVGTMAAALPVEPVVDFLAGLAGDGAALELAIGTGRIALPLAARGVAVAGIDLSPDMVAELRKKPGGGEIPVAIGDYATTRVDGTFSLSYIVFNSINNQTTQEGQVATFENAAAHLEPGGCFVAEVGVPSRGRLRVFDLSDTHVGVDEYDADTQRLVSHHFNLIDGRWDRLSMPFRSVSPAELDLMARIAGMRLRERWSGWQREPFTSESRKHVSVWEKA